MNKDNINTEDPKKSVLDWLKSHPKQTFWIRFVLWVLFACIGPVAFIIWRFELFTGNHMAFGGWGLVAVVIIACFIISLLNYIRRGLSKYTFVGQCISGFCKVLLPLITLLFIVWSIRDSVSAFIQALGCTILCECVAIPLNPLPSWIKNNLSEEEQNKLNSMSDVLWSKFFDKKKEN